MSNNESTIADMDGDFSDWVEIYNPDEEDINLEGYFLTDNSNNLTKWTFPKVILKSGEYLIVFASGKEKNFQVEPDEIHADFELSSSGEYLGLISADGKTVVSEIAPKFEKQND
ncbi:MAG: lamin tail domain-containing protein, partial [Verrucomicrobiales bacterium]